MGALVSLIIWFATSSVTSPTSDFPLLYCAKRPALVTIRKLTEGESGYLDEKLESTTETLSIESWIERSCPSLTEPYVPTWWLRSGHLNTVYVVAAQSSKLDPVSFKRTLLRLPCGGVLGLDEVVPTSGLPLAIQTPILFGLHGLAGSSSEPYVRNIFSAACVSEEGGGLGYRGIVMNYRGLPGGGVPLTTEQTYSAGYTDDIRTALLYITDKYPRAPIIAVGFSLGANALAKYVGEEGDQCRLRAACALGCPWDLTANGNIVHTHWFCKTFYAPVLGANLKALLKTHLIRLSKMAPSERTTSIQRLLKMRAPTLIQTDHLATRFIGGAPPVYPLSSVDAYYLDASSHQFIPRIRIPFISFSTFDDPLVTILPWAEMKEAPYVVSVITRHGGHVGWFEGGNFLGLFGRPKKGVRKPVLEFLRASVEDLGSELDGRGKGRWKRKDGFIMEDGKSNVGYRVIDPSEKIEWLGAPAWTDDHCKKRDKFM